MACRRTQQSTRFCFNSVRRLSPDGEVAFCFSPAEIIDPIELPCRDGRESALGEVPNLLLARPLNRFPTASGLIQNCSIVTLRRRAGKVLGVKRSPEAAQIFTDEATMVEPESAFCLPEARSEEGGRADPAGGTSLRPRGSA
jgi:hypothetical protein